MKVKNDYTNCLTNLACSIRRYFGLPAAHNTLSDIDEILNHQQPENVIVFLLDGMGDNIMNRTLPPTSFFRENRLRAINSVFPATTTACTMSMLTGLNPVEHGWLGWDMYVEPFDKTITLFLGKEKVSKEPVPLYFEKDFGLIRKYLPEQIAEAGKYDAKLLAPFIDETLYDFDLLIDAVRAECATPARNGRRYVYAYSPYPDGIMHHKGADSPDAITCMEHQDELIGRLCDELHNAVVIVVADHGHIATRASMLCDYPEIEELLERTPALEQRAASFKGKPGCHAEFEDRFRAAFGKDFELYTADDVIQSELFGPVGDRSAGSPGENPLFRAGIEDYIAICSTDRSIVSAGGFELFSEHAGWTDDELFVPLIVKVCQ